MNYIYTPIRQIILQWKISSRNVKGSHCLTAAVDAKINTAKPERNDKYCRYQFSTVFCEVFIAQVRCAIGKRNI